MAVASVLAKVRWYAESRLLLLLFAGNAEKLTNMGLARSLAGKCRLAATDKKAEVGTAQTNKTILTERRQEDQLQRCSLVHAGVPVLALDCDLDFLPSSLCLSAPSLGMRRYSR